MPANSMIRTVLGLLVILGALIWLEGLSGPQAVTGLAHFLVMVAVLVIAIDVLDRPSSS
jgi:hypothetical protein